MISKEDQLQNKANFIGKDGGLYLARCMNCANGNSIGTENWACAVAAGYCAMCGWRDEEEKDNAD